MEPTNTLNVSEVFYSIQGEGLRVGSANIFIRLQGCKAKFACAALGVNCDTEFESGSEKYVKDLHKELSKIDCKNIIWTGGEPAQQLDDGVVDFFKSKGYYQCIETSGLFPVPKGIDYIVVSPKVAEHIVKKNFTHVNELRYVRHKGQFIPQPSITADHYYLSPHSDGFEINRDNMKHCISLVLENPLWKISLQMHKIYSVL